MKLTPTIVLLATTAIVPPAQAQDYPNKPVRAIVAVGAGGTGDVFARVLGEQLHKRWGQPLVIEEVAVPRPGPGELLVKIEACGVCHTDLHAAEGDWPVKPAPPFIPGHEGVGHVVAVGTNVAHVKEGDRVGVPWLYSACGHCEHCLGGWETLCETQRNTGYSVNGGFAEYALADANYVGHLPANIGFVEIAPVLCAGVTVYKGLKMTEARPGEWVVISGIGGRTPGAEFAIGGSVNAALLSLTKALAEKGIADGVQVNCVNPGAVRTGRLTTRIRETARRLGVDDGEAARQLVAELGIARFGEPADIAGLVAFVTGPRGRFLQGSLIDMDGGQTRTI